MQTCWGILGTGFIARAMADALALIPEAKLVAVGSRTQTTADAFGRAYDVPNCFDSYQAVVSCPDVDVVYVATPHVFHARDAMMALVHGKAVLCEKPFTMNAIEAADVIELARSRKLFLMEAMWTRFVPAVVRLREWIQEKKIGRLLQIHASLGWKMEFDAKSRLFDPALGGGALLDLGVYPISFCSMLLGTPAEVAGVMDPAPTGVDMQCAEVMHYTSGAIASTAASFIANLPSDALVIGSNGSIRVHGPLFAPQALTLQLGDGQPQTLEFLYLGNGYVHEAIEVMNCIAKGKIESDIMSLDETLSVMQTLDQVRRAWGS